MRIDGCKISKWTSKLKLQGDTTTYSLEQSKFKWLKIPDDGKNVEQL